MKNKHLKIAAEFTQTFPTETTRAWQEDINRWDSNPDSKPDPYEEAFKSEFAVFCTILSNPVT